MSPEEKKKRHYIATEKWRKSNLDKCRAAAKARYWKSRVKFIAAGAKWRSENREKSRIASRRWQKNNEKKFKAKHTEWRRRNSAKRSAAQSARKARQLKATPAWANTFFIEEAYHLAFLRTRKLGFPWHVDHIVPLKSKLVCGLHVERNLRVIPGVDNIAKGNRYWPDMPNG